MNCRRWSLVRLGAGILLLFCGCQAFRKPFLSTQPVPSSSEAAEVPTALPPVDKERAENYRRALLLVQTMEMLRQNYVDSRKVTYEELFNHAMQGMVSALDPYSDYEPPREHSRQRVKRAGSVVGIGATAVKPDGHPMTLIKILPGTPAEKAKLRPGDQILAINGTSIIRLNLARALNMLRGRPGSTVTLQLRRDKREFSATLKRELVKSSSIVPGSVKLISGKIGYLKLTSFTASSSEEFKEALQKLKKLGARGIILDLRYNPGGLVDTAVNIASMLLEPEKIVFRASSRNKAFETTVRTRKAMSMDTTTPLIVLTNAFSASCSEILTGALQDHKRARVLGVRTFGKGTILRVPPLATGGAVRYASSHYVTPGGRVIEKKGIIPDIEVRIPSNDVMRLSSQTLRYPGSIKPPYHGTIRDLQLARAVEVLQHELKHKESAR